MTVIHHHPLLHPFIRWNPTADSEPFTGEVSHTLCLLLVVKCSFQSELPADSPLFHRKLSSVKKSPASALRASSALRGAECVRGHSTKVSLFRISKPVAPNGSELSQVQRYPRAAFAIKQRQWEKHFLLQAPWGLPGIWVIRTKHSPLDVFHSLDTAAD